MKIIYPVIASQSSLPIYLTGIGLCDPEISCSRPNGLFSHQFLFTLGGEGVLEIDGKEIIQTEGSCFYLAPGVPHKYHPLCSCWKTVWLVFRGNHLANLMSEMGFDRFKCCQLDDIAPYKSLIDKIYSAARDNINGSQKCSYLLYELILKMHSALCLEHPQHNSCCDIIKNAVEFIDQNYMQDITLPQLAELSEVSVQHFCRCFKTKMGIRPVEYIAQRRLSEAKKLLIESRKSITEIAVLVGYSSVTYFGMVFKKYEGISPTEFRSANC